MDQSHVLTRTTGTDTGRGAETEPVHRAQPILAADESVVGYELLFRESPDERRCNADGDNATRTAIDTLNLIGLGVLCDGRKAFIICTHQMLLMGYITLLPPGDTVVELQDRVPAEEPVRAAPARLTTKPCAGLTRSPARGSSRRPG
jgi:c-di-GMP-related signal transduction protein